MWKPNEKRPLHEQFVSLENDYDATKFMARGCFTCDKQFYDNQEPINMMCILDEDGNKLYAKTCIRCYTILVETGELS